MVGVNCGFLKEFPFRVDIGEGNILMVPPFIIGIWLQINTPSSFFRQNRPVLRLQNMS
jgi:hypothetical protein